MRDLNYNHLRYFWAVAHDGSLTRAAAHMNLSQSALSQHLAKLRAEEIVTYRRDGQALWYRVADKRIEGLLATLHRLYCQD